MEDVKIICDLCSNEIPKLKQAENGKIIGHKKRDVQTIFLTNQEDGRSSTPYLDRNNLDICDACYDKILEGNAVYGAGAMGYNKYSFSKKF